MRLEKASHSLPRPHNAIGLQAQAPGRERTARFFPTPGGSHACLGTGHVCTRHNEVDTMCRQDVDHV